MKTSAISNRQVVLTLGLILGLACAAGAQTAAASGPPSEGITVHGHWVIDVRNPDGSLASHQEFENELNTFQNGGASALAGLLGRQRTIGQWRIRLSGGVGVGDAAGPCTSLTNNGTQTIPSYCDILEPTSPDPADSHVFKNLVVTVPMTNLFRDFETGTIEFSGFVTATSTTQIGRVGTLVGLCPATVVATACSGATDFRGFTGTFLANPVVADVGQMIQVKVTLSFS